MKNFSERTNWNLKPNELTLILNERKNKGLPILDLTESNPTRCGFEYPVQEVLKSLCQKSIFLYEPSAKGLLSARTAIAEYYESKRISIHPENIFLTASTSDAYSLIFKLIANAGDRVLIPQPSYPLFDFLAELNDVDGVRYPLIYASHQWQIDFNSLEEKIDDRTKAILIVNPNNPTGSFIQESELEKLKKFAQLNKLHLVSDEVFHDYRWDANASFRSAADVSDVLTFTLNGISKMAGLPQMKLGWIVINGPKNLTEEAKARLEVIQDTYLSVNTPIQHALPEILKLMPRIQQQILNRLVTNRKYLRDKITELPSCELLHSEGGWYSILRVPRIHTDDEWTLLMLRKYGVGVHPGHFYHFEENGYLILSLLCPVDTFRNAIDCLCLELKS